MGSEYGIGWDLGKVSLVSLPDFRAWDRGKHGPSLK